MGAKLSRPKAATAGIFELYLALKISSLKKCKSRFLSKKPFSNKKASETILILKHSDSIPCLMFVTVAGKTCNQNNISSQFSWESLLGKSSSPQFIYIFFFMKKKEKKKSTNKYYALVVLNKLKIQTESLQNEHLCL